jgi:ferredoxin-NADP reductase
MMATTPTAVATFRLTKRKHIAHGTMAFYFTRPDGFIFRAGQAIDVTLIDPPETDGAGNTRALSIASAPADPEIMVTTRMRDTAFKRVLREARIGTEVKIDGPFGSFTLHKNAAKPAVFLAGGIGITPFVSIIRQATLDQLQHRIHLFYSNRRPEDAAFLTELQQYANENANFELVAHMSQMEHSEQPWTGERGYITRESVMRQLPSLQGAIYYIAGPPAMVAAMRNLCVEAGVDEDDIRTEEFGGY